MAVELRWGQQDGAKTRGALQYTCCDMTEPDVPEAEVMRNATWFTGFRAWFGSNCPAKNFQEVLLVGNCRVLNIVGAAAAQIENRSPHLAFPAVEAIPCQGATHCFQ